MTGWSLGGVTVNSDGGLVSSGMLLNNGAALQIAELDEPCAKGVRTRIRPGLFDHITTGADR